MKDGMKTDGKARGAALPWISWPLAVYSVGFCVLIGTGVARTWPHGLRNVLACIWFVTLVAAPLVLIAGLICRRRADTLVPGLVAIIAVVVGVLLCLSNWAMSIS
jgi:hypothetical protein